MWMCGMVIYRIVLIFHGLYFSRIAVLKEIVALPVHVTVQGLKF